MLAMVVMVARVPAKVPGNVMVQRPLRHVAMVRNVAAVRNVAMAPSGAMGRRVAVVIPRRRVRSLLRLRRKHELGDFAELRWFSIE